MEEMMPKKHWEENAASLRDHLPISITPSNCPDEHRLHERYVEALRGGSVFEIGCSPGAWLAYFAEHFDMKPKGIEYVHEGAEITRKNLALQNFPCGIIEGDFFETDLDTYDLVFSPGFIEHFPKTQETVSRIVGLTRPGSIVITTVPNFLGINGYIRKRWAPASYEAHLKLSARDLQMLHESAGLKTRFCAYGGYPSLIMPWQADAEGQPSLDHWQHVLHFAARLFNWLFKSICITTGWVPRHHLLSPVVLYIGERTRADARDA